MVFDAHSDLLYDVTRRRLMGETRVLERRHLDRLRRGGIEGLVLALWTSTASGNTFWPGTETASAAARTQIMMDCAREELAQCPMVQAVRTVREAEAARAAGKLYAFLGVEGMAAIGEDLTGVDHYYDFGVRLGMLTWNEENQLATGSGGDPEKGLTPLGRQAVRRMEDLGMLVDVSHLNQRGFWEVLDLTAGPVIASHSNSRALCDVPRNLTDEQLRAIGARGGVVGLNAYHGFASRSSARQTVEMLARHAVHMAEIMGVEHVGCGFDFCEFMGPGNEAVRGLKDVGRTGAFFHWLERLGMSERERRLIARENFLRVFRQVLG